MSNNTINPRNAMDSWPSIVDVTSWQPSAVQHTDFKMHDCTAVGAWCKRGSMRCAKPLQLAECCHRSTLLEALKRVSECVVAGVGRGEIAWPGQMHFVGHIVTLGALCPAQARPEGRRGETPTQSRALASRKALKTGAIKGHHTAMCNQCCYAARGLVHSERNQQQKARREACLLGHAGGYTTLFGSCPSHAALF